MSEAARKELAISKGSALALSLPTFGAIASRTFVINPLIPTVARFIVVLLKCVECCQPGSRPHKLPQRLYIGNHPYFYLEPLAANIWQFFIILFQGLQWRQLQFRE